MRIEAIFKAKLAVRQGKIRLSPAGDAALPLPGARTPRKRFRARFPARQDSCARPAGSDVIAGIVAVAVSSHLRVSAAGPGKPRLPATQRGSLGPSCALCAQTAEGAACAAGRSLAHPQAFAYSHFPAFCPKDTHMSLYTVVLLAVALSMDAFAVAVASGCSLRSPRPRHYVRLSAALRFFSVFHAGPGLVSGPIRAQLHGGLGSLDSFRSAGLGRRQHVALGIRRAENREASCPAVDPTAGSNLVVLSLATSIDALAVGLSFAMLQEPIWAPGGADAA